MWFVSNTSVPRELCSNQVEDQGASWETPERATVLRSQPVYFGKVGKNNDNLHFFYVYLKGLCIT